MPKRRHLEAANEHSSFLGGPKGSTRNIKTGKMLTRPSKHTRADSYTQSGQIQHGKASIGVSQVDDLDATHASSQFGTKTNSQKAHKPGHLDMKKIKAGNLKSTSSSKPESTSRGLQLQPLSSSA